MKLERLNNNDALAYLERYVNNGSPSGYSIKHSTSLETSPFGYSEFINPFA